MIPSLPVAFLKVQMFCCSANEEKHKDIRYFVAIVRHRVLLVTIVQIINMNTAISVLHAIQKLHHGHCLFQPTPNHGWHSYIRSFTPLIFCAAGLISAALVKTRLLGFPA
ncbi:hypothetical protein BDQ12DRAFT_241141 [Crucibulum laeve]|uniref:Uncharacterized protein n=1 Tax=Crucibulum laeve TaxID=68775 RepID=A0A5C3LEN4_9AGAR|nr:hypothetical protein BDQ12DRAFT_241141 [Crucibulum laeve]